MGSNYGDIMRKIESREAVVSVVGLGYVGLPLVLAFVDAGFRVVGVDLDESKVARLNAGESYVSDIPASRVAAAMNARTAAGSKTSSVAVGKIRQSGSLTATTEFEVLRQADAVVVCVPTPLNKTKDPDMTPVISATDDVARRLHAGMLVVLESTTYPGTTQEVVLPRLESSSGNGHPLKVGEDFFLAFSPERIDPGRKDYTVVNTPKVIGGVTPSCLEVAQALYGSAIHRTVPVSSPKVAEMVKLLENTFRAVNIGLVNEVAIMCDRLGMDVWEVIEAAKTKPFGFMPFYPGPGLGGHCIPIDPQYLAWKLQTLNYDARFIRLAAEINFEMPHYVVGKVAAALNEERKAVNGSKVLILGVAYKADVGDVRESPSLDLIHLLKSQGAEVSYHDPHVPEAVVDGVAMRSAALDETTLRGMDCVVIATAHKAYDWDWVLKHSRLVVDTRNATKAVAENGARVVKL
ncbi:MAG: nucleotide sugar dehydrogenase [SAR202 cluster bacterium]|nr:nucleotide sugar dehydrogenase [SAR202 cluster bacterium]